MTTDKTTSPTPEEPALDAAAASTPAPSHPEGGSELDEARAEADRYRDQLLRKAAEFENYKRRTDAEWLNAQRAGTERVLSALLPVLDDMGRSLKSAADQRNYEALLQGIELIHAKFLQTLKALGVEPIVAVGKPFNVDEHDALLQVPRTDVPPHTVVEEVEKGYRLADRVLRHAKVIVSSEPDTTGPPQGGIDVKA